MGKNILERIDDFERTVKYLDALTNEIKALVEKHETRVRTTEIIVEALVDVMKGLSPEFDPKLRSAIDENTMARISREYDFAMQQITDAEKEGKLSSSDTIKENSVFTTQENHASGKTVNSAFQFNSMAVNVQAAFKDHKVGDVIAYGDSTLLITAVWDMKRPEVDTPTVS